MVFLRHRSLTVCAASFAAAVAAGCSTPSWIAAKPAQADPALPFPVREHESPRTSAAADPPGPDDVAANLRRGHREAEAGRLDQAERYYERVLRDEPRNAVAHHRLGVIADERRDFPAAEGHYLAALRERPDDADLLNDLGYSYVLQGRAAEAERTLRAVVAASPRHERGLMNLALLYRQAGDDARAVAVLRLLGTEEEARTRLARLSPETPLRDVLTTSATGARVSAPRILTPDRPRPPAGDAEGAAAVPANRLSAEHGGRDDRPRDGDSRLPVVRGRGLIGPAAVASASPLPDPENDDDLWPPSANAASTEMVTANVETASSNPQDAIPHWPSSSRAAGYGPESAGTGPLGSRDPATPRVVRQVSHDPYAERYRTSGTSSAGADLQPIGPSGGAGPAMFPLLNDDPTPHLPPAAYASPGSGSAVGGGRYAAPPEYARSMTAPPRPDDSLRPSRYRVGHATAPRADSVDEYAEDLARQDADLARMRAELHDQRAIPSGPGAYSPRLAPYRSASSNESGD